MKKIILLLFLFFSLSICLNALSDAEYSSIISLNNKGEYDKSLAILNKIPESGKDLKYYYLKASTQVFNENQDMDINNINLCLNKVVEKSDGDVQILSNAYSLAYIIDDITLKNTIATEIEKIKDVSPEKEKYVLAFYLQEDKRIVYRDDMDGESTLICAINDLKYSQQKFEDTWKKGIEKADKPDKEFIINSISFYMDDDLKLKIFPKLLEIYPDDSYILIKQLNVMIKSKDILDKDFVLKCKEQIPVINKLISKDRDNILLKNIKILALCLAAEYNDCISYSKDVIGTTTKNKTAYDAIVCSYAKLKNIKQALYYFNRASEIFGKQKTFAKDISTGIWSIGDYYYDTNNYNDALLWYTKIESILDPSSIVHTKIGKCYYYIGNGYYNASNFNVALNYYYKSLEKGIEFDADDYDKIGNCCYALKDYQTAMNYYDIAYTISGITSYRAKAKKAEEAFLRVK